MPGTHEDALIVAIFPIRHAAVAYGVRDLGAIVGIETPALLAGCGVERNDTQLRRGGVEHAMNDDRIALHFRSLENVAGVKCPGNLELPDILPIDLVERRIAHAFRAAAIDFPVSITGVGNVALGDGGVGEHERCGEHRRMESHLCGEHPLYRRAVRALRGERDDSQPSLFREPLRCRPKTRCARSTVPRAPALRRR